MNPNSRSSSLFTFSPQMGASVLGIEPTSQVTISSSLISVQNPQIPNIIPTVNPLPKKVAKLLWQQLLLVNQTHIY
jgi:hypothetical protein